MGEFRNYTPEGVSELVPVTAGTDRLTIRDRVTKGAKAGVGGVLFAAGVTAVAVRTMLRREEPEVQSRQQEIDNADTSAQLGMFGHAARWYDTAEIVLEERGWGGQGNN